MILDELKAIKNVYCLLDTNKKIVGDLERSKRENNEAIHEYNLEIKTKKVEILSIHKIPQDMEIERQKIEIENAERISYNEKLLKNIKRKYKKDAIIKFLLLSLLNLFLSVAAFQIGFYTFTSTNYNDKQAENKGFIVGLIVGLSVFFILSIINLIKRIKECESPEDCGMYIPKKIIDTSKYSKENIDKFYLEKLNTATIELDALRRKRDKAAKMPINVANSFLVIQLNVFKENVDIAENCLNTLIKDSGIYNLNLGNNPDF